MTLTTTSLAAIGFGTLTLSGFEAALLTGGVGDNVFTVSSWNGTGSLTGAGGTDTVIASRNANFTLSDSQLVASNGLTMTFAGIGNANLTGGANNNVFTVSGWTGSGKIDGAGGTDQIVVVRDTDMALTNTSLVAMGFGALTLASVETANLSGGDSANRIVANAFTLGAVTLQGGNGDDILIGGTSSLSSNLTALNAIMAEWTSANSYATRVANLLNGGGANGTTKLNNTSVQNDSSAADKLTGSSDMDWFFQSNGDVLIDFNAGIGEVKQAI